MKREVKVSVPGSDMPITLVEPDNAPSPLPGLILCHHREGVDEFTIDAAERLAAANFVVAIPNFYHRRPAVETWEVSRKTMSDPDTVLDLRATADFLTGRSAVRANDLGIIGHCMGGRTAYLGAAVMDQMKAVVVLYGGGIFKIEGAGTQPPIDLTRNIRATILGLYGDNDHIISVDEIDRLIATLRANDIQQEFHVYEEAGHAFQDYTRPKLFFKDISEDAWRRSIAFLTTILHRVDS